MKGYKCFNPNMTCKGFQFKVGETHTIEGPIILCVKGFHFCTNPADVFNYYKFDHKNIVCEVEALGEVIEGEDKNVTNKIRLIKQLTWEQVLALVNSGYGNSGHRNSGNVNSGNRNSGESNSGDWNSGSWNSGSWNSGNRNSGSWNSGYGNSGHWNSGYGNSGWLNTAMNRTMFNKPVPDTYQPDFPDFFYFPLVKFIKKEQMTPDEKQQHPDYKIIGGYLKTLDYKEAWQMSWNKAPVEDKLKVFKLMNFDADIFEEITGIDVKDFEEESK